MVNHIAHLAGVPLEEMLPALAGTSTSLLVWLRLRLRRHPEPDQ